MFREAMTELSKEMQDKRISDEEIDAAIEAAPISGWLKTTTRLVMAYPVFGAQIQSGPTLQR